jgi:hypothetical protein
MGEFVHVAEELLGGPIEEGGTLPVHLHSVVRSLQVNHGPALAQRKGQAVNRPRDAKRIEIDRMRIGKNATDRNNLVAS